MSTVQLVHLVSASYDPSPVRRFAHAYRAHDAGVPHRLLVLLNRFDDLDPAAHLAELDGIPHDVLRVPSSTIDLPAYAFAARRLDPGPVCFLNSNAEPLCDRWLARLHEALTAGAGMVGATGSWESVRTRRPFSRWPAFPNPHLRTNAFMLETELMRSLDWPEVRDKRSAWHLESGRSGVTAQVLGRDLPVRVVGRQGEFDPEDWPGSRTFRSGEQENLLVADNRTRDWVDADDETRSTLAALAWGRAVDS